MPDVAALGQALVIAALVAAATLLAFAAVARAWPAARRYSAWLSLGRLAGLAAGFYAGCGLLGQWPHWPATEDRHRFLSIVLPASFLAEGLAARPWRSRWPACLLRLAVAAGAAPLLLYQSVYVTNLAGTNSAEWSPVAVPVIFAFLAALLAATWGLLARLQSHSGERACACTLALCCLAAGVTVMLSGYFTGGELGWPLAGALAGVALGSFASPPTDSRAVLGVGIVGLFAVLTIGRFFGSLPTPTALCLLLTPLLAWVAAAPGIRTWPAAGRTAAGLVLLAAVLAVIVARAQRKFDEAFRASGHESRLHSNGTY